MERQKSIILLLQLQHVDGMCSIVFRWQNLRQGPRGDNARERGEAKPTVGDRTAMKLKRSQSFPFASVPIIYVTHSTVCVDDMEMSTCEAGVSLRRLCK